jgi:hypothetical protein
MAGSLTTKSQRHYLDEIVLIFDTILTQFSCLRDLVLALTNFTASIYATRDETNYSNIRATGMYYVRPTG